MSAISFKTVASRMDPLYPPTSMKELLARFRYPDKEPGRAPLSEVSFWQAGTRVCNDTNYRIDFLHYNTRLMKGSLELKSFIQNGAGLRRFAACAGLGLNDVVKRIVEEAGPPADQIFDQLFPPIITASGVSINPARGGAGDAAVLTEKGREVAEALIEQIGGSLGDILDFIEVPFESAADIVLEMLGIDPAIPVAAMAEADIRSAEIGEQLASYGLVSLCEVWKDELRQSILDASRLPPTMPVFDARVEAQPGEWGNQGSGMMAFSPKFTLSGKASHVYRKKGVSREVAGGCDFGAMVDFDPWTRKGVQLSVLETDLGNVELYSTQMYGGANMEARPFPDLPAPNDMERVLIRAAQIQEFLDFLCRTHDPRNVAMIAGDFNIAANSPEYGNLTEQLKRLTSSFPGFEGHPIAFDDWWAIPAFANHLPSTSSAPAGFGSNYADGGGTIYRSFDSPYKAFPQAVARPDSFNEDDYYCDEAQPQETAQAGERIDYLFVERPTGTHTFMLDVTRVRRRAFRRRALQVPFSRGNSERAAARNDVPGTAPVPQPFLSNHLGLEVTLYVSPRYYPQYGL